MKQIPQELADHVCEVGVDTASIARLASLYHRSLARRYVTGAGVEVTAEVEALIRRTRRLSPAVVRSVYRGPVPGDGTDQPLERLAEAATLDPTEVFEGSPDTPWVRAGLQDVLRSLGWGDDEVGEIEAFLPELRRSHALAVEGLTGCWPEAVDEMDILVDQLVFVRGPVRSATVQSTFGAVWAEVEEANEPLRMFELLLHETAHHSLALKEQFATFLENPDDLGSHAFRPDPRPLRGVLHAAVVMARIGEGLRRYTSTYGDGGPLQGCAVQERTQFADDALLAALAILTEQARWTEDGTVLRRSLEERASRLAMAS